MSDEDIDFLISIQDLEKTEFDNACLQRENKRLQNQLDFMIDRNDEKQQIIDKAREFIYRYWITYDESKNFTEFNEEMNILIKDIKKLLEILGDKENEKD